MNAVLSPESNRIITSAVDIARRLPFVGKSLPRGQEFVQAGYLAAALKWQVIDGEEFNCLSNLKRAELSWTEAELRDDPFHPDLKLPNEEQIREERECEMVDDSFQAALEQNWRGSKYSRAPLNSMQIRVELALRLRGKIQDYAGMWWRKSVLMWAGYLQGVLEFGLVRHSDVDYLLRFLPETARTIVFPWERV